MRSGAALLLRFQGRLLWAASSFDLLSRLNKKWSLSRIVTDGTAVCAEIAVPPASAGQSWQRPSHPRRGALSRVRFGAEGVCVLVCLSGECPQNGVDVKSRRRTRGHSHSHRRRRSERAKMLRRPRTLSELAGLSPAAAAAGAAASLAALSVASDSSAANPICAGAQGPPQEKTDGALRRSSFVEERERKSVSASGDASAADESPLAAAAAQSPFLHCRQPLSLGLLSDDEEAQAPSSEATAASFRGESLTGWTPASAGLATAKSGRASAPPPRSGGAVADPRRLAEQERQARVSRLTSTRQQQAEADKAKAQVKGRTRGKRVVCCCWL